MKVNTATFMTICYLLLFRIFEMMIDIKDVWLLRHESSHSYFHDNLLFAFSEYLCCKLAKLFFANSDEINIRTQTDLNGIKFSAILVL